MAANCKAVVTRRGEEVGNQSASDSLITSLNKTTIHCGKEVLVWSTGRSNFAYKPQRSHVKLSSSLCRVLQYVSTHVLPLHGEFCSSMPGPCSCLPHYSIHRINLGPAHYATSVWLDAKLEEHGSALHASVAGPGWFTFALAIPLSMIIMNPTLWVDGKPEPHRCSANS